MLLARVAFHVVGAAFIRWHRSDSDVTIAEVVLVAECAFRQVRVRIRVRAGVGVGVRVRG